MQYAMSANSTLFVRVAKKEIKKDFVIRISAAAYNNFHPSKAFYVSDLPVEIEPQQLLQYINNLVTRYNFANFQFVV